MLMSGKIKAFTIIEVAVTMVLSSIVVGSAIYVFFTFNKVLFATNKNNLIDLELIQLQQILKSDFIKADEINYQYGSIVIKFMNEEKTFYDIEDQVIIREAVNGIDTFNIEVYDIYVYYNSENSKLVNELILDIEIDNLDFPIHVIKKYPNSKLFEH